MVAANPRSSFCGRGLKVSKEGAKKAAFVPTLSYLLSDPCGGEVARRQSQQLRATVAGMGGRGRTRGASWPWGSKMFRSMELSVPPGAEQRPAACVSGPESAAWPPGSGVAPGTTRPPVPYMARGTVLTFRVVVRVETRDARHGLREW